MTKAYASSERTNSPLSGAREANGFVFISGQVHMDADGKLVGETIEEKLEIVMGRIQAILKEAGLTLDDIVSVRLYLTDLTQLPALNAVYPSYFTHPLPTRTTIGVSALPLGASLEMDAIAVRS